MEDRVELVDVAPSCVRLDRLRRGRRGRRTAGVFLEPTGRWPWPNRPGHGKLQELSKGVLYGVHRGVGCPALARAPRSPVPTPVGRALWGCSAENRYEHLEAGDIAPMADPGGVGQQMTKRHRPPRGRAVGEPAVNCPIQRERTTFGQQQYGHGGELLTNRCDPKRVLMLHGYPVPPALDGRYRSVRVLRSMPYPSRLRWPLCGGGQA